MTQTLFVEAMKVASMVAAYSHAYEHNTTPAKVFEEVMESIDKSYRNYFNEQEIRIDLLSPDAHQQVHNLIQSLLEKPQETKGDSPC